MTSVNIEKTLDLLKIPKSLWFENFRENYSYVKEYFDRFPSNPKHVPQAQKKRNQ